jgi:hypothetical protein
MAITSIKTGSSFTNLIKYNDFLGPNPGYDPAAMFLIQRIAGTGSSSTITFSSIPQNYKHLQIRATVARVSSSAGINSLEFNNDSSAVYATHRIVGNGSFGAVAQGQISRTNTFYSILSGSTTTSTIMGVNIVDIHDYSSTTKNKTVRSVSGYDTNGDSSEGEAVYIASALWPSTSAITSIKILSSGGQSFTTTSTFALYGMVG